MDVGRKATGDGWKILMRLVTGNSREGISVQNPGLHTLYCMSSIYSFRSIDWRALLRTTMEPEQETRAWWTLSCFSTFHISCSAFTLPSTIKRSCALGASNASFFTSSTTLTSCLFACLSFYLLRVRSWRRYSARYDDGTIHFGFPFTSALFLFYRSPTFRLPSRSYDRLIYLRCRRFALSCPTILWGPEIDYYKNRVILSARQIQLASTVYTFRPL